VGIKEFMKSEENNSRRLRWKEEHGRILISIWKEKYPQVCKQLQFGVIKVRGEISVKLELTQVPDMGAAGHTPPPP
jgi:hypothetical protein